MRAPLTVAVVQPACAAPGTVGAVAANVVAHVDAVRRAEAALVVFPELSLTGYELDAPAIATAGEVLVPLVEACTAARCIALVGAPVADADGREHIAVLHVSAAGVRVAYRKTWLGAAETARFTPGDGPHVEPIGGWAVGIGICKDTGTAAHIRDVAALGVDLYVAGLVHHAEETATQEARAVAIATRCRAHVAFASFAGPTGEGYVRTAGRSGVWDPEGAQIVQAGTEPGEIVRATLR